MNTEFRQSEWNRQLEHDLRQLIRLAVLEDLDREYDWTTVAVVPEASEATAHVVARQAGVAAGLAVGAMVLQEMNCHASWQPAATDGATVRPGQLLATVTGRAHDLLAAERTILNFLGRLGGIATAAQRYVREVAGTPARIYDTRKTLPGWRRLEKYAVRCGGAFNHRQGLYDAILIKDNHLVAGRQGAADPFPPADAVRRVREFLSAQREHIRSLVVEIEVDSLEQFRDVLPTQPDIVLLDNFSLDDLRAAVSLRQRQAPAVVLEASGGVTLQTVRAVAETGIDRISVGAMTHSAPNFDLALDWQ